MGGNIGDTPYLFLLGNPHFFSRTPCYFSSITGCYLLGKLADLTPKKKTKAVL